MVERHIFDQYLWELLLEQETQQYLEKDPLQNGLMTFGSETIHRVGFAVSESMRIYEMARAQGCDALVVHHGIPFRGTKGMNRFLYDRFAFLVKHNISLWSAHYLLDAHSVLGNNAQILDRIGARKKERSFFEIKKYGAPWGWIGEYETPQSLENIVGSIEPILSPRKIVYDFGTADISRVAVMSGKGAPDSDIMAALVEEKIDLFITGELHEWNRELAYEAGIHLIGGGHYATETVGVKALMRAVETWGMVETCFLDLPNEV